MATARPIRSMDPYAEQFWAYTQEKELRLQKCSGCGKFRFPPGPTCDKCLSDDAEWAAVSGRGKVYSYTVVRRQTHPAFPTPYTVALVEMEEGPRIAVQVRDHDGADIPLGAPAHVEWEDHPRQALPVVVLD